MKKVYWFEVGELKISRIFSGEVMEEDADSYYFQKPNYDNGFSSCVYKKSICIRKVSTDRGEIFQEYLDVVNDITHNLSLQVEEAQKVIFN